MKARARRAAMQWTFWLTAAVCLLAAGVRGRAEGAEPVRKVYVEPFQGKDGAEELRASVVARLREAGGIELVNQASDADLVVRGEGETWIKGYVSLSRHPNEGTREANYGGYLSLGVENRAGETVWSYLVTPGRMHWAGVEDDMARHIVKLMLAALKDRSVRAEGTPAPSIPAMVLTGAGSTFAAPLYQVWGESFAERHPDVQVKFQPVGSEAGVRLLEEGKADFAASEVPAPEAGIGMRVNEYATVLGGVVPAYNLPESGRDLRFTPQILAEIYLGSITRWNDAKLRAVNRGVDLPDAPITVVHRTDGSGTSFAWTQFLSAASAEWRSRAGHGFTVTWPTGAGVAGNEGVAAKVEATPGAIGYMELTYALRHRLNYGSVRNAAGHFVQANLSTLNAAARSEKADKDSGPGQQGDAYDAYPVTTYSWILVPADTSNPAKKAAMRALLEWMLTTGQKECAGLDYVPLPRETAQSELRRIGAEAGATPSSR